MEQTTYSESQKKRLLWTTSMVSSLIMLDSNIVAVSLPAIGKSIHADFTDIQWIIGAYLLTYASLLLAAGAFADHIGRKKSMLLGLLVFGVSSFLCGFADSAMLLNIARAVQGVGAALLLTAALAIITQTFTGTERARAFAVWGACLGVALTSGPILGGIITHLWNWRWVFFVNVPLCLILIVAASRFISESRDPNARALDFPGILTFSPGLCLMIWALIDGNDVGWAAPGILIRLAGSVMFFVAFVLIELKQQRPMVDLALFKRSTFLGSVFAMLGYGATAQVMVFILPLYLQNAYDLNPEKAGLAMIPFALPMVLAPRIVSKLSSVVSGRFLLTAGLGITVAGNLLFYFIAASGLPYSIFFIAMIVAGAGAGILNGETAKVLGSAVPPERSGMASGLASTTRFIGILLGVAGLGAVLSGVARETFMRSASAFGLTGQAALNAAKKVISGDLAGLSGIVPRQLESELHRAGLSAFARGFASAGLLATCVAAIACILTFHYVKSQDTAPLPPSKEKRPCKTIDCRDPL